MDWRFCDSRHFQVDKLIASGKKLNITQIGKATGFVQSHLSILFDWEYECGMITRKREGQDTYIEFTDFGKEFFEVSSKFAKFADEAIKNREKFRERAREETK